PCALLLDKRPLTVPLRVGASRKLSAARRSKRFRHALRLPAAGGTPVASLRVGPESRSIARHLLSRGAPRFPTPPSLAALRAGSSTALPWRRRESRCIARHLLPRGAPRFPTPPSLAALRAASGGGNRTRIEPAGSYPPPLDDRIRPS